MFYAHIVFKFYRFNLLLYIPLNPTAILKIRECMDEFIGIQEIAGVCFTKFLNIRYSNKDYSTLFFIDAFLDLGILLVSHIFFILIKMTDTDLLFNIIYHKENITTIE